LADRIRAHVLLYWLGLPLIRVAENETGETWHDLKRTLKSLQVGIHRARSGEVLQTTRPTADQARIFDAFGMAPPPRHYVPAKPGRQPA